MDTLFLGLQKGGNALALMQFALDVFSSQADCALQG